MKLMFSGLKAWALQRVSAVYMAVFSLFVLIELSFSSIQDYDSFLAWVSRPHLLVALFVFYCMLLLHAWVGIRDVLLDYAKPLALRLFLLAVVGLVIMGLFFWVLVVLLKVSG